MIHPDSVVTPKTTLLVEHFDDAMLIWDEDTGKPHHLEATASVVWGELDGERTLGTMQAASPVATPLIRARSTVTWSVWSRGCTRKGWWRGS